MRRQHLTTFVIVAALVTTVLGAAAPASAVTGGTVTALAITPGAVSAEGLTGTGIVHVSVTASDTRGPIGECSSAFRFTERHHITVELVRTSGGPTAAAFVRLTTHTTEADGEHWSGDWRVGSTRNGTWTAAYLWWCVGSDSYGGFPRDLGLTSTVTVTGTRAPTATFARVPRIAGYDAPQSVVATYRGSSGRPLVGYRIAYGTNVTCGSDVNGRTLLTTDRLGRVTVRLSNAQQCLYFTYPGGWPTDDVTWLGQQFLHRYTWYRTVGAALATSRTHVGSPVTVLGAVYPVYQPVSLQQLVGRTWRTLQTNHFGVRGRVQFTYVATSRGTTILRLLARSDAYGTLAPTPSRTLRLTVT
jgi:hypothetical protein